MRLLFTLMLLIAPLFVLSQDRQKDIERNNRHSWVISNDAAQAYHYLTKERDSLLKEVGELRKAVDTLEKRNKEIIDRILESTQQTDEQLENQSEASQTIEESNDFIQKYWKGLSKSTLSSNLMSDAKELNKYQLEFNLRVPLSGKFTLLARPTFAPLTKPVYLFGINYKFF
jgi:uncharacterized coiled-coil DUF342 family protein